MQLIYIFLFINVIFFVNVGVISADDSENTEEPDLCPEIVTRRKWGAKTAKAVSYLTVPLDYVIIHHTVGQLCSNEKTCSRYVRNIQAFHQNDNNYWDIGYKYGFSNLI